MTWTSGVLDAYQGMLYLDRLEYDRDTSNGTGSPEITVRIIDVASRKTMGAASATNHGGSTIGTKTLQIDTAHSVLNTVSERQGLQAPIHGPYKLEVEMSIGSGSNESFSNIKVYGEKWEATQVA